MIAFGLISFFENSLLKDFVIFFLGSYLLFLNANRMEIAFNLKNMSQKIWPYLLSLSSLNLILCFFLIVNPLKISGNTYLSILLIVIEIIYFIQNCVLCFGISKNLQKNEIVKKEEKE